jgi:hypothetical protein
MKLEQVELLHVRRRVEHPFRVESGKAKQLVRDRCHT